MSKFEKGKSYVNQQTKERADVGSSKTRYSGPNQSTSYGSTSGANKRGK